MGASASERGDSTPNNRKRDGRKDLKERRQYQIKYPRELMGSCILPIMWSIDQPNKKSPTISQWAQTSNGDGEQILPTVEREILTFQNNATVFTQSGLWEISEIARINGLEMALILIIKELWLSFRRRYWEVLRRKRQKYKQYQYMQRGKYKNRKGSLFSARGRNDNHVIARQLEGGCAC